jgi:GR25 family glycosyltransferase involved in LPS biosynthesis
MEILNSKNIYIINLDHRKDRLESINKQFAKKNIKYTRFSAIIPNLDEVKKNNLWKNSYQGMNWKKSQKWDCYTTGALGCKMSHYYIVKKAKELNMDYVIILEDDFLFTEQANEILKHNIFDNLDDNWDFIFLGGRLSGKNIKKINNIVMKTESVITTIGYILNKKTYDSVLKNLVKYNYEIDSIYSNLSNKNYYNNYIIDPNLIYQTMQKSNITAKLTKDWIDEKEYKKKDTLENMNNRFQN